MRVNATVGSAKKIDIPGYFAGGKTGTADRIINGRYATDRVNTTFMSIVPADKPKYLFFVMMEDPQAAEGTYGFHTAAWNSGEVCGKLMERVAPLLDMPPDFTLPKSPFPHVAREGVDLSSAMKNEVVPVRPPSEHRHTTSPHEIWAATSDPVFCDVPVTAPTLTVGMG